MEKSSIKLTNYELVQAVDKIKKYADKRFPQKIAYAIIKDTSALVSAYKDYMQQLNKLFDSYKEHTEHDENGNPKLNRNGIPVVDESVREQFFAEINELLNIQFEIEVYKIPEELFDYDDCGGRYDVMTPSDLEFLQLLLT